MDSSRFSSFQCVLPFSLFLVLASEVDAKSGALSIKKELKNRGHEKKAAAVAGWLTL